MRSRSVWVIVSTLAAGVVLLLLATWIVMAAQTLPSAHIRLWPAEYRVAVPAWLLLLGTLLFPLVGLVMWIGVLKADPDDMVSGSPLIICPFLLLLLGALDDKISFLSAGAVLPFALGAIASIAELLGEVTRGSTLGIESRWGGLGGGIGGWKLTRGASLLLVAALLVAGTVMAVRLPDSSLASP